jgi:hypothetical protein
MGVNWAIGTISQKGLPSIPTPFYNDYLRI